MLFLHKASVDSALDEVYEVRVFERFMLMPWMSLRVKGFWKIYVNMGVWVEAALFTTGINARFQYHIYVELTSE